MQANLETDFSVWGNRVSCPRALVPLFGALRALEIETPVA